MHARLIGFISANIVLTSVCAAPASASWKTRKVEWKIAGSFLQNVATADDPVNPLRVTGRLALIEVEAKGPPGRATIRGIGRGGVPAADLDSCFVGADLKLVDFFEDSLIATFRDLSILYAGIDLEGDNFVCVDFDTGRSTGRFDIDFNGGFGRFEGASGDAVVTFEAQAAALVVDPATGRPNWSAMLAERGAIRGKLTLP